MNNPKNTLPLLGWLKPITHRRAIPLFILAATLLIGVATVLAVHDIAVFELDGDVTSGSSVSGIPPPGGFSHDWDQVCKEATAGTSNLCSSAVGSSGAGKVLFITDASGGSSASDDQPVTGGTHHVNDLNLWDCKIAGISPVKNDITHAFAGTYTHSGDTFLYFGLDRIDAGTGDAAVGFWFYKGTHTCTPVSLGGAGVFTGLHQVGDLLVVSEFTNGGGVSTIKVYKWVGDNNGNSNSTTPPAPGAGNGPNQLLASGVDCRDAAGNAINFPDNACATVNKVGTNYSKQGNTVTPGTVEGNIVPPWPYTNNDGGTAYALGAFFEGGVNATALGLSLGCGGTFLADTQASQSLTSQIHDFAVGTLSLCDIKVTKDGDTLSKVGDDVDYTITIENTGAVILYKQSIIDDVLGDLTDGTNSFITSSDCGDSLNAGASCTVHLTRTVLGGDPDPLVNTVTVIYDSQSDLLGDEVTSTDDHTVNLFQPSITLDKTGDKTSAHVGDTVNYTVVITNTSSGDSPNLIRDSITDTLVGDLTNPANFDSSTCGASLASSASCTIHYHHIVLVGDSDPLLNTATAHYHPDGFLNNITAQDSWAVDLIHPATTLSVNSATTTVHEGDPVNISVRETNSGDDLLTGVHVDGTNSCASFTASATKVGGGAFSGSLAAGEAVDFTCSFTAGAAGFTWTADGHGTDSLGQAVPATGEHVSGDVTTVDLQILITGDSTNAVGVDHTFTVTVNQNTGSGFTPVSGATVGSSISGLVGATITGGTCTTTTTDGSGQCTIIAHSLTAGTGTVHASTTVSVSGVSLTRATSDGLSGDSSDTHKTWVDANIQINPPTATNEVGTNHTLTGHVNVNPGTGFVNAPAGTTITSSIASGPGSFVGGINTCLTVGTTGSCTVQITSATAGTTVIHATTDVTVGGVLLHRETDGTGSNSVNANKTWISPATTLATKSVSPGTTVTAGTLVTIIVTETNSGDVALHNVSVTGGGACAGLFTPASVASLAVGASADFTCTFTATATTTWTADGQGLDTLNNPVPTTGEHQEGTITVQVLFAGCTPGFFKNHYNTTVWGSYYSNPTVGSVFTSAFGAPANATLLDALSFPGGSGAIGAEQNLLRAAVSALLNTQYQSSPLPYPLTTAQVISMVNAALASGNKTTMGNLQSLLDGYNNLEGPKC